MPEQRPKVLVVEDDVDISKVYLRFLSRLGCVVECATTGGAALETARRFCPDLVFVDTMLPDMLGTSVIEHLRSDPRTAQCRIVVVSGLDPEFGDRSADATLCKPFTGEDIAMVVQRLRNEWITRAKPEWLTSRPYRTFPAPPDG
jgi:CheY-like chemotaxis protein